MFLDDLFANVVGISVFLGFIELVVVVLLLVLVIRFLWIVPNELREIRGYLRKFYNRDDSSNPYLPRVDSLTSSRIQQSVEEDFKNSSTLR